ncbi:unnamed protein product [Allacma fusca]|uniref:Uncharacterized protein n=1 Tax=Allacma fusca TaxID=39272 RepID=A0A8J2JNM9_9HEXA|nr:unnamed protein product [Allacma fusca]
MNRLIKGTIFNGDVMIQNSSMRCKFRNFGDKRQTHMTVQKRLISRHFFRPTLPVGDEFKFVGITYMNLYS